MSEPANVPNADGVHRWLHVNVTARAKYGLPPTSFGIRGRLLVGDWTEAQTLAATMNRARNAKRYPELAVRAGDIYAAAIIHELMHALIASADASEAWPPMRRARRDLLSGLGESRFGAFLRRFLRDFPPPPVAAGERSVEAYLSGETDDAAGPTPNPEVTIEEAYLVHLANANPALERIVELFDDATLAQGGAYARVTDAVEAALRDTRSPGTSDRAERDGPDLLELLWAPQRASPTSLSGQLQVIRELWAGRLDARYRSLLDALVRAIDVLEEERRVRGVGGPAGGARVIDADRLEKLRSEPEAFSSDSDWMPRVVMVAKSTYVWLHQLERRYGTEVRRLDQVPQDALRELADRGFNALWLIGIWQRSEASRRIKRRRGQGDAMASAYALHDYVISDDMGGEAAYQALRDRAAAAGLRLASDMVPNHVGIDGRWVAEHPDWFVQLDHPPYPGYRFEGEDLSGDERIAVRIEDHYWDDSDAAVVFQRVDEASGEVRYVYHGNDGTSMPWNDTAQLDYLNPTVREAVIQTILRVAKKFPIIRFDAAMTLAKEHVRRLWYPPPGHGGAIPSRSQYGAMDAAEFERRMPHEFWREVVDRVAAEAPGTLLLAEAFWMMEGYFVRTLGMHRVYNSAFMNMLKDEANAAYRATIANVLAFDPRVLERFVNFMNNPDEDTAINQFGDGDKYFGVTTLMATLPGLPLFGHGQVEGLREKYGMEYRAARWDESPNEGLIERHQREVAPLLRRRADFAGAAAFRMFDLVGADGSVIHDVYAYANQGPGGASLVLYNNRYQRASGRLHMSVPFVASSGRPPGRQSLAEALGLPVGQGKVALLPEPTRARTTLLMTETLAAEGLLVSLDGYETRVHLDVRVVDDPDGSYAALAGTLGGRPVADVEDERLALWYRDLHAAFGALLVASARADASAVVAAAEGLVGAASARGSRLEPAGATTAVNVDERPGVGQAGTSQPRDAQPRSVRETAAALLAALGPASEGGDRASRSVARASLRSQEPGLAWVLRAVLAARAVEDGAALWRRVGLGRALADVLASEAGEGAGVTGGGRPDLVGLAAALLELPSRLPARAVLQRLARSAELQRYLRVHDHAGVRWFDGDRYRLLRDGLVALAAADHAPVGEADERPAGTAGDTAGLAAHVPADDHGSADLAYDLDAAEAASDYRFERLTAASRRSDGDRGPDEGKDGLA